MKNITNIMLPYDTMMILKNIKIVHSRYSMLGSVCNANNFTVTDAPEKSTINTVGKAAKKRMYSTSLHCFDLAPLRLCIK